MKKETIAIFVLILICLVLGFVLNNSNHKNQGKDSDDKIQKVFSKVDSLEKENSTLKVERTILLHEAQQLKHSIDSLRTIRPINIIRTNNEIKRFYNSDIAGKLAIGDSILLARKKARNRN